MSTQVWLTFRQQDMTEGRGPLVQFGPAYASEQEAWDAVNNLGGVMGRRPGKNCYPMDKLEGVHTWQEAKERLGGASLLDYDVRPTSTTTAMTDAEAERIADDLAHIEQDLDEGA